MANLFNTASQATQAVLKETAGFFIDGSRNTREVSNNLFGITNDSLKLGRSYIGYELADTELRNGVKLEVLKRASKKILSNESKIEAQSDKFAQQLEAELFPDNSTTLDF